MKAISLTQPYASLVMQGQKTIETRSWRTSYRGPLAIHAAKGFPNWAREMCETEPFLSALGDGPATTGGVPPDDWEWEMPALWETLPTGCIVAVCDLVEIYPTSRVLPSGPLLANISHRTPGNLYVSRQEESFGDYSLGRFAWVLDNIIPLPKPVPARGALSLWEWDGPHSAGSAPPAPRQQVLEMAP